MKKFFALLLALVMSLSLVACGGGDTANEDTSTDDTLLPRRTAAIPPLPAMWRSLWS